MWFSLIACRVLKILGILGSRANCEMCRDTYFAQNGVRSNFALFPPLSLLKRFVLHCPNHIVPFCRVKLSL